MAAHLGSDVYYGGWRHGGAGHINPLAFTRGLARAVRQEGGRIHENSPVLSMRREADGWNLRTPQGEVRCRRVVMVTAAHTGGLWPGLASTIVPVTSYQLATAPLPPDIAARILPYDEAASDTRFDLRYFRKDRDGRLITGGALAIQLRVRPRLEALVSRKLAETFPFLAAPALPFFWGGRIAMTTDRLPRLHRTADGLIGWIGCNGRGLALSMAMGGVMRDAVLGLPDDQLPLAPSPFVAVPLHPIVRRVARLALLQYRRKDAREVG
jgi:glycine/D-amino acid oxidase-like deaminating enzyme